MIGPERAQLRQAARDARATSAVRPASSRAGRTGNDAQRDPQFSVATVLRWRTAHLAAGVDGRPRFSVGLRAAKSFRTLATARKIALVSSLRIWNSQIWWGTSPNTARKGSGYRGEPSVVTPRNAKPRSCRAIRKRRKKAVMSLVIRGVIKHLVQEPFEGVVVDDGQDAKRPIIQLIDRDVPREVRQAPVEIARPHLPRRLFPPGLHPVLDGGEGNKHAVIAPQMPAGGLIGQAVLDDEAHGQGHDAMGVVGFGQRIVGHVRVEVLAGTWYSGVANRPGGCRGDGQQPNRPRHATRE